MFWQDAILLYRLNRNLFHLQDTRLLIQTRISKKRLPLCFHVRLQPPIRLPYWQRQLWEYTNHLDVCLLVLLLRRISPWRYERAIKKLEKSYRSSTQQNQKVCLLLNIRPVGSLSNLPYHICASPHHVRVSFGQRKQVQTCPEVRHRIRGCCWGPIPSTYRLFLLPLWLWVLIWDLSLSLRQKRQPSLLLPFLLRDLPKLLERYVQPFLHQKYRSFLPWTLLYLHDIFQTLKKIPYLHVVRNLDLLLHYLKQSRHHAVLPMDHERLLPHASYLRAIQKRSSQKIHGAIHSANQWPHHMVLVLNESPLFRWT